MLVHIHLPDNGEHVLRLDLGLPPAAGTSTPELSLDESPPSNVRYDYGAVLGMTPAGLPPAGTATSWAAPRRQAHLRRNGGQRGDSVAIHRDAGSQAGRPARVQPAQWRALGGRLEAAR